MTGTHTFIQSHQFIGVLFDSDFHKIINHAADQIGVALHPNHTQKTKAHQSIFTHSKPLVCNKVSIGKRATAIGTFPIKDDNIAEIHKIPIAVKNNAANILRFFIISPLKKFINNPHPRLEQITYQISLIFLNSTFISI